MYSTCKSEKTRLVKILIFNKITGFQTKWDFGKKLQSSYKPINRPNSSKSFVLLVIKTPYEQFQSISMKFAYQKGLFAVEEAMNQA